MATTSDRIQTLHPDPDKSGPRIDRAKYDAVRTAILRAVPRRRDGLPFAELAGRVRELLPARTLETLGSVPWYTVTVKLDLEARGEVERVAARAAAGAPPLTLNPGAPMSDANEIGKITWRDLTVADAEGVAAFYRDVVGWTSDTQDMGEYHDFCMNAGDGDCVAGICHARGANATIPAQWLVYITVADADASAKTCVERGGEVLDGPRDLGKMRFCVIRDPAGAVAALVST